MLDGRQVPPARILAMLKELGSAETVETPCFLPGNKKGKRLQSSRFAVIPPNTGEDFGWLTIGARLLGIPFLLTSDYGVTETAGPHSFSSRPRGCPHPFTPSAGAMPAWRLSWSGQSSMARLIRACSCLQASPFNSDELSPPICLNFIPLVNMPPETRNGTKSIPSGRPCK